MTRPYLLAVRPAPMAQTTCWAFDTKAHFDKAITAAMRAGVAILYRTQNAGEPDYWTDAGEFDVYLREAAR